MPHRQKPRLATFYIGWVASGQNKTHVLLLPYTRRHARPQARPMELKDCLHSWTFGTVTVLADLGIEVMLPLSAFHTFYIQGLFLPVLVFYNFCLQWLF
jgi:hypothetical protein